VPLPDKTTVIARQTVRRDHSVASPSHAVPGLRILAHVHNYPPTALTGGSYTMHHLLRAGRETRGWMPRVITDLPPARSDVFDGVPVRHDRDVRTAALDYRTTQVVITHLNATSKAIDLAGRNGRPLVHLVHNDRTFPYYRVALRQSALAIFNSVSLRDLCRWSGPSVVLHPITAHGSYHVAETGESVLMVNLSANKGAAMFYELARKNPGVQFLGVKGTFGKQIRPPALPNLEVWEPQVDIREAYRQARILIMPSLSETWGRVAVEAAISGIPSICSDTPGMREAGVASLFLDPHDFEGWNKAVRHLIRGPVFWAEASEEASKKAFYLDETIQRQTSEACERIESLV